MQQIRFKLLIASVLVALIMSLSTQNVFAAVLDQKQETITLSAAAAILSNDPIGQEFQPALPILEAVEVNTGHHES